MNRLPWVIVVVVLAAGASAQATGIVRDAAFHQFQDLQFTESDFSSTCETGGVVISEAGRTFQFIEGKNDDFDGSDEAFRAFLAAGCGTMRRPVSVQSGADRLVVRFEASRERTERGFDGPISPLIQDFVVRDASGGEIQSRAIFEPAADSHELNPFEFTFVGEVGGDIFLDWVFQDAGVDAQGVASAPLTGTALDGSVRAASVEAIRDPSPGQIRSTSKETRDGTRLTSQHMVVVDVPALGGPPVAIRVSVDSGVNLVRVVAPDGDDLGAATTFEGGVLGRDHEDVVVQVTSEYVQATVPQAVVADHGPGEYTFVFEESRGVKVSPALVPFSIVLLAAPLPFAILAWVESRAFRKEAFGGYARSARNLQWGVSLVLVYYGAVVASAAAGGRLALMAVVPMSLEGALLYVQLLLAGVAFTALWLVARELYLLVKPRPERASDDAV